MAESNSGGSGIVLLAAGGFAAYYFWPQIAAALGISTTTVAQSSIPSTLPAGTPAGVQTTNSSPSINTPGAVPIGTQGCFSYAGTVSCPPGVSPPAPAPVTANCAPGWSVDASGVCTQYTDVDLVAGLNSIPWSGATNIPAEQIARIDPQILAEYSTTTGVDPGSVLAYMLGLGGSAANDTIATGSDGNIYEMLNGMWTRQPNPIAKQANMAGLGRLGRLAAVLPVTNATLIQASHDPATAAILGTDPRGLLTVNQWNYFYSQASGVLQTKPTHPRGQQGAKVNAQQYQQLRAQAGLPTKLGSIRSARPGAFPSGLGPLRGISQGPSRKPFVYPGNRNIYRIPGRGAVPQKLGVIQSGGGDHRWGRSPFPRPSFWRQAE
jgi:hypothetical protein